MIILFDVWNKFGATAKYSPEEEIVFKSVYDFIYDRIYFMDAEIEKEENEATDTIGIFVYLMSSPMIVLPVGYSNKLHNRIVGSFNENDVRILWESVQDSITRFLN